MRECTQTYMTENTRNGDNVMRSLFKGKRRNKNAYPFTAAACSLTFEEASRTRSRRKV